MTGSEPCGSAGQGTQREVSPQTKNPLVSRGFFAPSQTITIDRWWVPVGLDSVGLRHSGSWHVEFDVEASQLHGHALAMSAPRVRRSIGGRALPLSSRAIGLPSTHSLSTKSAGITTPWLEPGRSLSANGLESSAGDRAQRDDSRVVAQVVLIPQIRRISPSNPRSASITNFWALNSPRVST
jgi:hypothetical protein